MREIEIETRETGGGGVCASASPFLTAPRIVGPQATKEDATLPGSTETETLSDGNDKLPSEQSQREGNI